MKNYQKLEEHFGKVVSFNQISSLIDWDKSVMMPEQGAEQRARQVAALGVHIHEMTTDQRVADWIAEAENEDLNDWQRANLRLMKRQNKDAACLPADLVEKRMVQETRTEVIWRKAKAESDFSQVSGELQKLLDIVRACAEAKGAAFGVSPYESLMDSYAPYMTTAEVDGVFDDLAVFLPGFITRVMETQKEPLPLPDIPSARQEAFGRKLADFFGFDRSWSRLDVSAHPFSTGIGGDVRITTRYIESDFMNSIQGVAHEAGHGFYDRHTPTEWQHQPVGASQNMGMAIHESQSLSLDMQLGRCREYWDFLSPHLQDTFGVSGAEWSGENLHRHAVRVDRTFIRIDADEVTYPAHIILRYRLERKMIEGKLAVRDLPEAWNAEMKSLLGVVPPDDRRGCLQDIHWYCGAFGYFPAYALGAMISAQFVARMRGDIPDLDAQMRQGKFPVFVNWLRDNVHRKACLLKPQELIENVTGEKFSARFFKDHLSRRYLGGSYA